mmetsp:Transcript_72324/g.192802  ORF Transcript_72324/g.192802 Transcript_72324/m.192802 type:complete len:224 (-) Transcript_72324:1391-2062(-)
MCFLMQSAHWASLMSGTVRAETVIFTVLLITRAQFPHSPSSEYRTSVTDRAGSSQVRLRLSSASSPLRVVPNAPRGTPRRAQIPSTVTPCTAFLMAIRSISHIPLAPSVNPGTAMPRRSVRVFPKAKRSDTGSFSSKPPCSPECRSRSPPVLILISTSNTPRIPYTKQGRSSSSQVELATTRPATLDNHPNSLAVLMASKRPRLPDSSSPSQMNTTFPWFPWL